jgi:hypothetical protein
MNIERAAAALGRPGPAIGPAPFDGPTAEADT